MYKFTAAVIVIFSGMLLSTSSAADWSSDLQGGGTVSVDPDTRRATITRDGVTSPLWNGVHRLQDGSAMIINNGEVVTGAVADTPHRLPPPETSDWEGLPIAGYSPCEQLTHRVCGLKNQCATSGRTDCKMEIARLDHFRLKSKSQ